MLWRTVHRYVEEHRLIQGEDFILAGLSGGADSICLARYLLELRERAHIPFCAVHVNHGLRGEEARRDEAFCAAFCARWEIPFYSVEADVLSEQKKRRCSLEEAGRLVRYETFRKLAGELGCNKIAVAHHKNDLAETMVFRLARGTGIGGLAAIRPEHEGIIRPLLCLTREEILQILSALGQDYVEDSTNRETEYSRNYIRRKLMPELEQLNERAVEHMARTAERAAELMDYLEPVFQKVYDETVFEKDGMKCLKAAALAVLPPVEQKEVVRRMFQAVSGSLRDVAAAHVDAVLSLSVSGDGKQVILPGGRMAVNRNGYIWAGKREQVESLLEEPRPFSEWIEIDREKLEKKGTARFALPDGRCLRLSLAEAADGCPEKRDCVKCFDYDRIYNTLCLRTRQSGDYFIVDKEGRHKMLRRYFIDEKIPAARRSEMLLLADGSHILWIIGGRNSEGCRLTPATKRVLRVVVEAGAVVPENSAL